MSTALPDSSLRPAGSEPGRPAVDVIVPFAGSAAALERVCRRMASLQLGPGDSLVLVDNTRRAASLRSPDPVAAVLHAPERPTPGFARNRGAARGGAPWIVFLDADVVPCPDLLDRYFDPPPEPETALIGGGLIDERVPADAPVAARYAHLRNVMSQERTFDFGRWGYPKTANVACRRAAFEQIRGFREEIRAAEDADLAYRLQEAGWGIERRETAVVVHLSRRTLRGLVTQQAVWGAGGAWLARTHPGSIELARGSGLVRWALLETAKGLASGIRRGDRDAAIYALVRPLEALAWELGRLLSNERRRWT